MFPIDTKGVLIEIFISFARYHPGIRYALATSDDTQSLVAMSALLFGLLIIPNLIFAFLSIAITTEFNKKFCKIIFNYPAV